MWRGLLPISFIGFVALGLPDGVLGVAWPSIRESFERSLGELGIVLVALTAGYLISGIANGFLTARLGTGRLLVIASGASTAGAFAYALTGDWWVLIAMTFGWGAAGASIDAGVNAHVAINHGSRAMGLLHAGFGIGATLGPLLIAAFLDAGMSWRGGYVVLGIVQLAMTAAYWATRSRWAVPASRSAPAGPRRRRLQVLWAALATFFFYTGVEVAAGQWSYTLFTEQRGFDPTIAAALVAGYWGSLTVGRLLLGLLGDRMAPEAIVRTALLGVVPAVGLLWWNPADWIGAVGLLAVGLSLAPIFPSLMVLTPRRFGVETASSTIGFQLSAAALGAAVVPGIIGLAIENIGLGTIGPLLAASGVALAGLGAVDRHLHPPTAGSALPV